MLCINTGGNVTIERTEPATQQAQHKSDERWFTLLNVECKCRGSTRCGDQLRELLAAVRAKDKLELNAVCKELSRTLRSVHSRWSGVHSKHNKRTAAACDHAHMPRELLPRLGYYCKMLPDVFPYVPQSVTDAVRAMRFIRSSSRQSSSEGSDWQLLRERLQRYAATGTGSLAEAILVNDCCWRGEVALEVPPKKQSTTALAAAADSDGSDSE
jgi:hypothetical protein